jgi:hypothetical protein
MKRKFFTVLFCVSLFGVTQKAAAQIDVLAAPILATLQSTKIENALFYLDSLAQAVTNATNTYNQFQNMLRQEKMALDNLSKIGDVRDYGSFTNWFNRQLYLERRAENKFNAIEVTIGTNKYPLAEIADMPKAVAEGYFDKKFWENSLSERERIDIWNKMGLTPENYAYLKVWQAREKTLKEDIVTKLETINEENKARAEARAAMIEKINADADMPEDQKMGDKELAIMQVQTMMDTNEILSDMRYDNAVKNELEYAQGMAGSTPANRPTLSEHWGIDPFDGFSTDM